jgi:hypothetical protein
LCRELPLALRREPVIPGFTVVLRRAPERGDPAAIPETIQGRVKRSVFNLKYVIGDPLYGVGDRLAMGRTKHECLEDQQIQCARNHFGLEGRWASWHVVLSMID